MLAEEEWACSLGVKATIEGEHAGGVTWVDESSLRLGWGVFRGKPETVETPVTRLKTGQI